MMKNTKSLIFQLVLQIAIVAIPLTALLLYQTASDVYHSEKLERSYRYLASCQIIKSRYARFVNGAVDAVDTGQLGADALRALQEAAEKLGNLAREDSTGNLVKLQEELDNVLTALKQDRSLNTLMLSRALINRIDVELSNVYLRYERENRQAIESNIAVTNIRKKIVPGAILVVFAGFLAAFLVSRRIIGTVRACVAFAGRIAQGDLSSRMALEGGKEFRALADSLNRMAGALREAQDDLVRKEKLATLGQLAGCVGHELRNPLGVMSNAVYYLQTVLGDRDDTVREYLGIIKKEIFGAERIVSDLLDAVRTKPPRPQLVSAEELIRMSLGKCRIPENITVDVQAETQRPVSVDPFQMDQVFVNLISNAVDAMPGGGRLTLGAADAGKGGGIRFSIKDEGPGIAPENRAQLFQPLFTTKARGIGLGLVVAKNLTEANGGIVSVDSEAGKGTTFTVTLPAAEA